MTPQRYSRSAMTLHWAIALALAFQFALGWRLEDMPKGPGLFSAYQLHKSVGMVILLLTVARIAIRFAHPRPALPVDSPWAQRLARLVHGLLYVFMIGAPLTGWALVSTAKTKVPTLIFQTIPLPHLPLPESWHESSESAHGLLAFMGILLFLLHVAGALRHQFVKREPMLVRMVPFAGRSAVLAVLGAFGVMFGAHAAGWQWRFSISIAPSLPVAADAPAISSAVLPELPVANLTAATEKLEDPLEMPKAEEKELKTANKLAAEKAVADPAKTTIADQAQAAPVPLSDWQLAPGGQLRFQASWTGMPIAGRFNSWGAKIRFSPDQLDKTDIRVTVDLASANTNDSQRDSNLQGDQFFNTAAHPQAVFTANNARSLGGDRYAAAGTLNLHGVTRPVTLTFTLKFEGNNVRVSGGTQLDRTAFGVGSGEYAKTDEIGGSVPVTFAFQARRP